MKHIPSLTLDDARAIGAAAEAEATAKGWKVTIAVVDAGGHLMWLQRMDDAPLMSAEVAAGKARTCVMTGKPSKALEDMINGGRTAAVTMPILPLEGGEMIVVEGSVVGAVGVSGVRADQDAEVARAGIVAIGASCSR